MTDEEILHRFDVEMRMDPPLEAGVECEKVGGVVRTTGGENAIYYAALTPASADAAISEQIKFYGERQLDLAWKVYGHDRPPDLQQRLERAGFEPAEWETLMTFDLHDRWPVMPPDIPVEIRPVSTGAELDDYISVSSAAFERDDRRKLPEYLRRLNDPANRLYVAYAGNRPVTSARLELPPGKSFAGLWGGGTVPEFRSRGIYRALVSARAKEAVQRGFRFLTVDARDTSRPILQRIGFHPLISIREWTFEAAKSPDKTT